jgi:hypothetical protein
LVNVEQSIAKDEESDAKVLFAVLILAGIVQAYLIRQAKAIGIGDNRCPASGASDFI